jgi:hypothetical protein
MALYLLNVHLQTFLSIPITQKCQILSCDTLVANEPYNYHCALKRLIRFMYQSVRPVMSKLRPAGQTRPPERFYPRPATWFLIWRM